MTTEGLPAGAAAALDSWLAHHDRLAPGLVEGCYVVGSVALDDWTPRSDIDIVAFTAEPPTDADAARLRSAHEAALADLGEIVIDGPYLAWGDVTSPPLAAQRPWTLDREFHFDGECFEINPVTWFTLATHARVVRGVEPSALGVYLSTADRQAWVRENVDTYWRSVRDQVAAALAADPATAEFDAGMFEWCALGVARMAYTMQTGGVASKGAAGAWAAEHARRHGEVFTTAMTARRDPEPQALGRASVTDLVDAMTDLIATVTGAP